MHNPDVITSYRAVINNGQQLRDGGLLSESCDVLFLYGSCAPGNERQLCWLEMSEAHDDELDELMNSLPHSGVVAIVRAMSARRESLGCVIDALRVIKEVRHA